MPTEPAAADEAPRFAPLWDVTWRKTCPRCGEGKLLDGFLTVREKCSECGLYFGDQDVADGPAVLMTFVLGFTVVPLAVILGFALALPAWAIAVISIAVLGVMTWALMPPAKAFWVAVAYRQRIRYGSPAADESPGAHD